MSWQPQYRSSKYRHVFGKAATKENCYDCVPITKSVHENHFCAVNPHFLAVVTECAGGGAFLVIPIQQTGKLDPHHPKISGHKGNVLDIKWNPFNDFVIASCSEDTTVKIWEIPKHFLSKSITTPAKELLGHARRVGLIEWHPTANNILFSTGYDYKVLIWNLDTPECVLWNPVRTIDVHKDVILSLSFNTDGSYLATACKDRKVRILDARSGKLIQESNCKSHKASKVLFLGNIKKVISTGTSKWNHRQIALWDQDDLSVPLQEEDLDGSSGLLFPFYDADTQMLYVAGRGDGNVRYYEISTEKPYMNYLTDFRTSLPQKGIGAMPKRGLDVSSCEVFRFYRLITIKSLIEPVSMIVPRRSESYQDDIYPLTPGGQPAVTAKEWLNGINKGPLLISLKPGTESLHSLSSKSEIVPVRNYSQPKMYHDTPERIPIKVSHQRSEVREEAGLKRSQEKAQDGKGNPMPNGLDVFECPPPKTENELLQIFYRQQDEIRRLRELVNQRDVQIKQLALEIKNVRNSPDGH
ncbi:coronin-2A [Ambystoma mexicanum]|uniref:coronin-2A n=1 Tax=Ambystoma mexicanum TaxID=8296 RepID=UPI0037E724FF